MPRWAPARSGFSFAGLCLQEVINAVQYLVRSDCGWRMLPIHFGAWQTVYGWPRELAPRFLSRTMQDIELMLDRERQGWQQSPSDAVIDSQSIKRHRLKSAASTPPRRSPDAIDISRSIPMGGC
jgi:transposase